MSRYWLIVFFIAGLAMAAEAQQPDTLLHKSKTDSIYRKIDSAGSKPFVPAVTKVKKEKVYHPDSTHSPHLAVMRSLMVPGWGQIYNHHWWKVPVIYAGLGVLGYYIVSHQHNYKDYLALAKYQELGINYTDPRYDNDPHRGLYMQYASYPKQAVIDIKEFYRRNRDLCILGFIAGWGIQTIDAYIWAKFKHSYSMDNDLGIHFSAGAVSQPVYASNFNTTFTPVLKITVKLK